MMKYFKSLSALFAIVFLVFGCSKEYSREVPTGNTSTAAWEFKEGSTTFKGPVDTAYIDTVTGVNYLTIEGTTDDGSKQLTLSVIALDIKAGNNYPSPMASITLLQNGAVVYDTDLTNVGMFTIKITSIDANGVTGTFSGKVKDGSQVDKEIINGKFSAKFKSSSTGGGTGGGGTPPPTGNCKLASLVTYDAAGTTPEYSFTTGFNGSTVNKWSAIDSSSGGAVDYSFNVTYPSGKIQLDANQYFLVNGNGQVTEFWGYLDPSDNTSDKIIVKYTYNGSGQLTTRSFFLQQFPTIVAAIVTYTYNGNLLTKSQTRSGNVLTYEELYEYDNARTVKVPLQLYSFAPEILRFQSLGNFGKFPDKVITKITQKTFDIMGGVLVTEESTLDSYVIDSNGYIQSFKINGSPLTGYGMDLMDDHTYKMFYKCF